MVNGRLKKSSHINVHEYSGRTAHESDRDQRPNEETAKREPHEILAASGCADSGEDREHVGSAFYMPGFDWPVCPT